MARMLVANWKQWAVVRPTWLREDIKVAFKMLVEKKWRDALNVLVAAQNTQGVSSALPEWKRPPQPPERQGA